MYNGRFKSEEERNFKGLNHCTAASERASYEAASTLANFSTDSASSVKATVAHGATAVFS